eukprot:c8284_g1_i1.p1 GENE.c8284_g1_i1~~c8284_g1_i1.p1  ORF type:complete len:213 (-),score=54.03 c8284_g1_i1:802-1389(-)
MALNPPTLSGLPQAFPSEVFVLRRIGIRCVTSKPFKYSCDGELFISTLRMIFVAEEVTQQISGFDIPLANMSDEAFNQPIFGCNNLAFRLSPIPGGGLSSTCEMKLEFRDGGAGTFLEVFIRSLGAMRETLAGGSPISNHVQHPFSQSVSNGTFVATMYTDPNDPSTLYMAQPSPSHPPPSAPDAPKAVYSAYYQ